MNTATAVSSAVDMPSRRLPRALLFLGRVGMGLVFIYAAYAKLYFSGAWHFSDYHFLFAMMIDSYRLLPLWAVQLLSAVLPWFELVLGALLISGLGLRWVSVATSALLLVFIAAMAHAKFLGLEINCGCFGNNEKLGTATLLRDSSFLVLSLLITAGAFLTKKRKDY